MKQMTNMDPVLSPPSRKVRIILWGSILVGVFVLFFIVLGGLLAAPDIFRNVPIPEVVNRIAREKQILKEKGLAGLSSGEQSAGSGLVFTNRDGEPVNLTAELIPNLPGIPSNVLTRRAAFNDDYTSLTQAMALYRAEAPLLSYEDSRRRIDSLWQAKHRMSKRIYPQEKEAWMKVMADPDFRKVSKILYDLDNVMIAFYFENYVRHEQWGLCAGLCEFDQYDRWPEEVYYLRRQGGIKGISHLIGGSLYIRSVKYPIFDRVRDFLPYQQGANLSDDRKRRLLKYQDILRSTPRR